MSEKDPAAPIGRPPFKPSIEQRQTVEQMKYCGESDATIARALGIHPQTLREHLADELANGHAARREEVIGLLFKAARDGNVPATRRLEEIGRMVGAKEEFSEGEKTRPAPKIGKKEVVRQDALVAGAGSEWGDDLKPPADLLPN